MDNILTVVAPIAAVGALYVVAPVVAHTYRRFRGPRTVTCPENHESVEIQIDAGEAAASAAFGKPELRVKRCARWPEHQHCGQECLAEVK